MWARLSSHLAFLYNALTDEVVVSSAVSEITVSIWLTNRSCVRISVAAMTLFALYQSVVHNCSENADFPHHMGMSCLEPRG